MADPVASDIAGGVVTTATTTVAFTAQAAGRLLVLAIAADDYRTTSGSGRPESTGWTYVNGQQGNLGLYVWYRVSDGTETSVQYTIGSGARSVHKVLSITDIDSSSPLGVNTAAQGAISGGNTSYAVPTITPTAGARWIVVGVGGVTGNNTSGPYTWPAGWAKIGTDRYHTTGYRPGVTAGSKVQDGGAPSGAATVTWTASSVQPS